jgi:hypothetical protein
MIALVALTHVLTTQGMSAIGVLIITNAHLFKIQGAINNVKVHLMNQLDMQLHQHQQNKSQIIQLYYLPSNYPTFTPTLTITTLPSTTPSNYPTIKLTLITTTVPFTKSSNYPTVANDTKSPSLSNLTNVPTEDPTLSPSFISKTVNPTIESSNYSVSTLFPTSSNINSNADDSGISNNMIILSTLPVIAVILVGASVFYWLRYKYSNKNSKYDDNKSSFKFSIDSNNNNPINSNFIFICLNLIHISIIN